MQYPTPPWPLIVSLPLTVALPLTVQLPLTVSLPLTVQLPLIVSLPLTVSLPYHSMVNIPRRRACWADRRLSFFVLGRCRPVPLSTVNGTGSELSGKGVCSGTSSSSLGGLAHVDSPSFTSSTLSSDATSVCSRLVSHAGRISTLSTGSTGCVSRCSISNTSPVDVGT